MTRGTSTMSVYLSWTESEQWAEEPTTQDNILRTFAAYLQDGASMSRVLGSNASRNVRSCQVTTDPRSMFVRRRS